MGEMIIQDSTLHAFANKIREKNNTSQSLNTSQMLDALDKMDNVNVAVNLISSSIENVFNSRATSIGKYGLYQQEYIVSADLPNVTQIGDYAFYKCPSLTHVNAPLTQSIGAFVFKGCSALTSANYLNAVTIGQGTFDECTTLSSVNLPLLTTVEPLTFRKCEALTAVDLPITTTIKSQAFWSSGLTSLTLRSSTVCTLEDVNALAFTPIEEGIGYIYVPENLVNSYKSADGWSVYANQIRAIV